LNQKPNFFYFYTQIRFPKNFSKVKLIAKKKRILISSIPVDKNYTKP